MCMLEVFFKIDISWVLQAGVLNVLDGTVFMKKRRFRAACEIYLSLSLKIEKEGKGERKGQRWRERERERVLVTDYVNQVVDVERQII